MIPTEIAELCGLIDPDWTLYEEEDIRRIVKIAYRVFNAGYRKTAFPSEMESA